MSSTHFVSTRITVQHKTVKAHHYLLGTWEFPEKSLRSKWGLNFLFVQKLLLLILHHYSLGMWEFPEKSLCSKWGLNFLHKLLLLILSLYPICSNTHGSAVSVGKANEVKLDNHKQHQSHN